MKKYMLALALVFALLLCGCKGFGTAGESKADESSANVSGYVDLSTLSGEKIYSFEGGVGTFYYPDEDYNLYLTVEREFDGTAQNVIDILYELGNYSSSNRITVNSCYKQDNILFIDFDNNFYPGRRGGTAKEYFEIYGTCKTLISCFKVEGVRFTIEGEDLDTGQARFDRVIHDGDEGGPVE